MTKEKPFKKIIDAITGEETILELTAEEIAEMQAQDAAIQQELADQEAEKQAQVAVAESAVSKLTGIGFSAEEIAALRG